MNLWGHPVLSDHIGVFSSKEVFGKCWTRWLPSCLTQPHPHPLATSQEMFSSWATGPGLGQGGDWKAPRIYSCPCSLIPEPLPTLEAVPSFFSWANGFPRRADAFSWHLHLSGRHVEKIVTAKGLWLAWPPDEFFFSKRNHNNYLLLFTKIVVGNVDRKSQIRN